MSVREALRELEEGGGSFGGSFMDGWGAKEEGPLPIESAGLEELVLIGILCLLDCDIFCGFVVVALNCRKVSFWNTKKENTMMKIKIYCISFLKVSLDQKFTMHF